MRCRVNTSGGFPVLALFGLGVGMPSEPLVAGLEEREVGDVRRQATNPVLERMAETFLRRPAGISPADPRVWCQQMLYAAETWIRPGGVVLVVLEEFGE